MIYTSACLLTLNHCIETVGSSNLIDFIFSNCIELCIIFVCCGIVHLHTFTLPWLLTISFSFVRCTSVQNYEYSNRKFASGDIP
jgi:hypothetical protein